MHSSLLTTLLTLLSPARAAPASPAHDICAAQTYRCSPILSSIEVCNPVLGWRLQATCAGPTCALRNGVPHCYDGSVALEDMVKRGFLKVRGEGRDVNGNEGHGEEHAGVKERGHVVNHWPATDSPSGSEDTSEDDYDEWV